MNNMKKTLFAAVIISAAGLSGCASTESTQESIHNTNDVEVMDEAALAMQKVKALTEHVEQQYESSKDENYVFFAPDSWKQVNSAMSTMRTLVTQFDPNDQGFFGGPSESKVIDKIEEAQAALDNAKRIKELVSVFLTKQLADIEYLTPQVHGSWQSELNDINETIADLIADIEDDNSAKGYEKRSAVVQNRLLQLEIKIVKSNYYTPLIKKMKALDQDLIPQTYVLVEQSVKQLDGAIILEPRNKSVIETIAAKVEDDLRRANNVTTEVNWINRVARSKSEQIALRYRNAIATMAFNLFDEDISSLTYVEQVAYFDHTLRNKLAQQQALNDEQAQLIMTLTEKGALIETDGLVENKILTDLNTAATDAEPLSIANPLDDAAMSTAIEE